jgi:hypothetical protein
MTMALSSSAFIGFVLSRFIAGPGGGAAPHRA